MSEKEIWKSLKSIDLDRYEVSNYGNVRSVVNGDLSKRERNGYYFVRLYVNGKRKDYAIHRLVGFAFVNNPDTEKFNIINHIDENKKNNFYKNLEWCDIAYNVTYGTSKARTRIANIRAGNFKKLHSLIKIPVFQFNMKGEIICEYESITECKRKIGSSIVKYIDDPIPVWGGYIWSKHKDADVFKILELYNSKCDDIAMREIVYCYDFFGKETIYKDVDEVVLSGCYTRDGVKNCIDGNINSHKERIWSRNKLEKRDIEGIVYKIKAYKKVYQYDLEGKLRCIYNNIDEIDAEKYIKTGVQGNCNSNHGSYRGYIWSYGEITQDELNLRLHNIHRANRVYVYRYDLDGNFIKKYDSVAEASRDGFVKNMILNCIANRSLQHNDQIWSGTELEENEIVNKIKNLKLSDNRYKKVIQYDKDMNALRVWKNMREVQSSEYRSSAIPDCCKGKRKTHKNCIWKYEEI